MSSPKETLLKLSRDQLACAISVCQQLGDAHHIPLLRAVRDGLVVLAEIRRDGIPTRRMLDRSGKPVIALVGDDDYASTGPDGWAATRRLLYWARGALIHGTGGKPEDYELAVQGALECHRFLLVETSSDHLSAWVDAMRRAPKPIRTVIKRPFTGTTHPVVPSRETVQ